MTIRAPQSRCLRLAAMVAGGILALPTLAACTASAETPASSASASPPTGSDGTSTPEADVHEIDLGDGRVLYMSCAGSGEQTVVLESGYHESSDTWMVTEDETDRSVFARLADRYRVCAYDRPGTLLLLGDSPSVTERSTPVPMPRSAADVVDDLHTAFDASGESGPFILTAHSLGGFLARLYAQTYPDDLDGLVLVDAFPIELRDLMGDTWAPYYAVLNSTGGGEQSADYEQIDIEAGIGLIEESGPFPAIPIGVISKELPFAGLPAEPVGFTADDLERAWVAGQPALVALRPDTPHLIATGSDHYVHVRQPALVEAMVDIVAGRADR